ncbi:VWA domain-containing protein [Flavobacterium sp.]|uniref:VWA domain-containing protein n=1 Tax=Flavobacterium sp. TaxID=239 RepID=UPI002FDA0E1C
MQFKHPEILYFLFLLVLPILVHLFQLRRFKKEYFTNVKFLKELTLQTRKSSQLKKWLLLATRMLLLTALILAFAQPFFKAKDATGSQNDMYILLDNSFSMQAKGAKGELLKRAVQDLLATVPENLNFTLLTTTDKFQDTDIKSIQKDLQQLNYHPNAFDLANLLDPIEQKKNSTGKDIIILSDGVNLNPSTLQKLKPYNTLWSIYKAEKKENLSIDSVFVAKSFDNLIEIGVVLKAYGTSKIETSVAVQLDNKLVAKSQISENKTNTTLYFTLPKEDAQGVVSIEDNSLNYDNTYFFSLNQPKKSKVLSIGAVEKSLFLRKIYTEDEFDYVQTELQNLDFNSLELYQTLVLNEIDEIPQALQTTLKSYYEKGGNIIFIPSSKQKIDNLKSFVSPFGNFALNEGLKSEKLITEIAFNHPLYAQVFEKKVTNFQYPKTLFSFPVTTTSSSLLSYEDKSPFLMATTNGVGNFYFFNAALSLDNSNFQKSPLIVPTFYNMVQNATLSGLASFTLGDNQPRIFDLKLENEEIVSLESAEDKQTVIPQQQTLHSKVKLIFGESPQKAGNYQMVKNKTNAYLLSFNYPRTESDLNAISNTTLENISSESLESHFNTLQTNRLDNTLWKWFVGLALLFVLLELLIQKFVK